MPAWLEFILSVIAAYIFPGVLGLISADVKRKTLALTFIIITVLAVGLLSWIPLDHGWIWSVLVAVTGTVSFIGCWRQVKKEAMISHHGSSPGAGIDGWCG